MKIKVLLTIGAMSLLFAKASHSQEITFDVNHFNVTTPFGNIDLGAQNDGWAHIYTDRPKFIVNKPLYIIGGTLSSYSTSNLRFQTNGSSRMTILNSNGNVGIGHTTPDMKLDVRTGESSIARFHHNGGSFISGVRLGRTSSFGDIVTLPTGFGIGTGTSGTGLPLNSQSSSHIDFFISNSTGNVGIGITDPKSKLSVDGDIFFNNKALVTAQSADATNIDHIWHDDAATDGAGGTWNFTSDGTYKKAGNSRLRAGHVYMVGTNSTSYFAGNVAIGTTDADMKLTVQGHVNVGGTGNARVKTRHVDGKSHTSADFGNLYLNYASTYPVYVGSSSNSVDLVVYGDIRCGSTTIPTGYKMAVAGKAIMEEVKVQIKSAWPDYVFTSSYNLQSLSEVESFINENGHLPNIPSASEVEENSGIELGAMNAKLLEKIEELTLHLINKDKQVTNLEKQNAQLEATLTQVLERLEKVESSVEK